jgi:hypothetical protein
MLPFQFELIAKKGLDTVSVELQARITAWGRSMQWVADVGCHPESAAVWM